MPEFVFNSFLWVCHIHMLFTYILRNSRPSYWLPTIFTVGPPICLSIHRFTLAQYLKLNHFQVKYKFTKKTTTLKYSNEVQLLRYFIPLVISPESLVCCGRKLLCYWSLCTSVPLICSDMMCVHDECSRGSALVIRLLVALVWMVICEKRPCAPLFKCTFDPTCIYMNDWSVNYLSLQHMTTGMCSIISRFFVYLSEMVFIT